MNNKELCVKSTCFATEEKLDSRELTCGIFPSKSSPDNFLFFLVELNYSYPNSKVIKKTVQILENSCKTGTDIITEESFEKILQNLNDGLSRLAESGENAWIGNLNAILGIIKDNEILLAQTGNVTGYIFRRNKISAIAEKNSDSSSFHPAKTFQEITSGQLIPCDRLIFGNFDLFNRISLDRIRTIIKDDNFPKETDDLYRHLRRNKVHDINAIFLGIFNHDTHPELQHSQTLLIDAKDESIRKFFDSKVAPVLKSLAKFTREKAPVVLEFLKRSGSKTQQHWQHSLKPKSKAILGKTANNISKLKTKIPEFNGNIPENSAIKGIRIKTNSYLSKDTGKKLTRIVKIAWDLIKNLKILFLPQHRKYLYIGLICIFIIGGYAKIKHNNNEKSDKAKEVQLLNSFDNANNKFAQIKEKLALGKTIDNNEINEALILAEKSRQIPANQEKASSLIKEIKSVLDERTKTVRIYPVSPANFARDIKFIALYANSIYGIAEGNKIYALDVREKEGKLVSTFATDYGAPTALASSTQRQSVIFSTTLNRLFSMDITSKTVEELKINSDINTWSPANAIATYSSNIYLLSSDNGVVWKHSIKDDGYTKGTSYLDTKKISLRGAVDFAIDGNIYVLSNEGSVYKYVKGTPEADFAIKNIPVPYDKILIPKKIFTDEDTNSIFVLDKKYERIIKFDKAGDFSTQYVLDGQPIDNFVVNAKLQKIWILSGEKVYEGNL